MAVGFRSSTSGDIASAGATTTITRPAGAVPGDTLVAIFGSKRDSTTAANTVTPPAGWVQIGAPITGTNSTGEVSLHAFVLSLGSDPLLGFSNDQTSTLRQGWVCLCFTGVDQTTPIDAYGTSNFSNSPALTVNDVTVATANSWHVIGLADWNGVTYSATGFTSVINAATNAKAGCLYNTTPKAIGSTGTVAVGSSFSSPNEIFCGVPFALRPGNVSLTPAVGALVTAGNQGSIGPTIRAGVAALALVGIAASRILGTIAVPASGDLTLTGQTPNIANVTRQPASGALTLSGKLPNIASPQLIPAVRALTLTGIAPSLLQGLPLTPGSGALAFVGGTATAQSGPIKVQGKSDFRIVGQTAVLRLGTVLVPSTGSIATDTSAAVASAGLRPGVASLTLAGQGGHTAWSITPGVGALALSGQPGAIAQSVIRVPTPGALTLAGVASLIPQGPTLSPVGSLTLVGRAGLLDYGLRPGAGSLALSGIAASAPVMSVRVPGSGSLTLAGTVSVADVGVRPGTGSLTLSGSAPVLLRGFFGTPTTGALTLTGQTATVSQGVVIVPGAGALVLASDAPAVFRLSPNGSQGYIQVTPDAILTPSSGVLVIDSAGGTITRTSPALAPGTGVLQLSGYPAIVVGPVIIVPGTASLKLVGQGLGLRDQAAPAFITVIGGSRRVKVDGGAGR